MLTGRATKGWTNTAPQAPMVQVRCNNTRSPTGSTGILYKAGCFVLGMRGPPSDSLQTQTGCNGAPLGIVIGCHTCRLNDNIMQPTMQLE